MTALSYSRFTLADVREAFDLTLVENQSLFTDVVGLQPSEILGTILKEYSKSI